MLQLFKKTQLYASVKEALSAELENLLLKTDISDKIVAMGDFNARAGRDHNVSMGKNHWAPRRWQVQSQWTFSILLELCAETALLIHSSSRRPYSKRSHGDTHVLKLAFTGLHPG